MTSISDSETILKCATPATPTSTPKPWRPNLALNKASNNKNDSHSSSPKKTTPSLVHLKNDFVSRLQLPQTLKTDSDFAKSKKTQNSPKT